MLFLQWNAAMFHTLPESCQAYLNRTLQPAVPFTLGDAHDRPHIWQSKVGGNPYLPLGADYPRNANGEPLTLLAQVNFAEMLPLPDFLSSGLLQFFIDGTDYSCGMDFEYQSMEKHRVVYHPEVTHDLTQLYAVQQPITCGDFRNELTNDWEKRDAKIWDILFDQYSGEGHRIGGYPFFYARRPARLSAAFAATHHFAVAIRQRCGR
ncbi:MAG: YwqG family protein [Kingella sp. (in: b-proteobacteria)]|nr:YwqG family protein [Kingella sp. (in: b-proteobacteria)]